MIDSFYNDIISVLTCAAEKTVPKTANSNKHVIPGWNSVVKESHDKARTDFLIWKDNGSPKFGPFFELMRKSRAQFKRQLAQCKKAEKELRAKALADSLNSDAKTYWKEVSKRKGKTPTPSSVGGCTGDAEVVNMWKNHYESILTKTGRDFTPAIPSIRFGDDMSVHPDEISDLINNLKTGASSGIDGISPEHLKYAPARVCVLLSLCFTAILIHGFVPRQLMTTVLVPIPKNPGGDICDKSNYRPVAVATMASKLLERVWLNRCMDCLSTTNHQFGFKPEHGTDMSIFVLKEILSYYKHCNTPVFVTFMDASKAFDYVRHDILFDKLMARGVKPYLIKILSYLYTCQDFVVKWNGCLSEPFHSKNGVKQGGITSPIFFTVYLDDLSKNLLSLPYGCLIGGYRVNHLIYADDLVIISTGAYGQQMLVDICGHYGTINSIFFNEKKTVCMLIQPRSRRLKPVPIYLNGRSLSYVDVYKYLGHLITPDLKDNDDIQAQTRLFYARGNAIIRDFKVASFLVKSHLFSVFCDIPYSSYLWCNFSVNIFNSARRAYAQVFRKLTGVTYRHVQSNSLLLVNLSILTFDEILRKKSFNFLSRLHLSSNPLVSAVLSLSVLSHSVLWNVLCKRIF